MNPGEALGHLARALLNGAPPRPEGVRARVGDQLIDAVDLSYAGLNDNGSHEWVATFDIDPGDVEGIHVDLLPGHTAVSFAFPTDTEDSA